MKKISDEKRLCCILFLGKGMPYTEINESLAISKSMVAKIKKTHGIKIVKKTPGPEAKIDKILRRLVARMVTNGALKDAVAARKYLKSKFSLDVSSQTVRRAMKSEGCIVIKKTKKLRLTEKHQRRNIKH